MRFTGLLLSLLLAAACSVGTADTASETSAIEVDDDAILSTLASFRTSPAFVRVNESSYETDLGTGALIDVYVSTHGFAPYASITPETSGTGAEVPEGTLIVREVKEPTGAVKSLTLMYKGPKGYNPELNDFWFGVTDPSGAPIVENGAARLGKLTDCYGCHQARATDGYLFGVPADVRPGVSPPAPPEPPPPPPSAEPLCGDFVCNGIESCALCGFDCGICPPPPGDDDDDDDDHEGEDDD
jgi:hypothetical protein